MLLRMNNSSIFVPKELTNNFLWGNRLATKLLINLGGGETEKAGLAFSCPLKKGSELHCVKLRLGSATDQHLTLANVIHESWISA